MAIYSEFSHWKLWFSIAMLVYQRVSDMENHPCFIGVSSDGFTSSIFWVFSILPGMMVFQRTQHLRYLPSQASRIYLMEVTNSPNVSSFFPTNPPEKLRQIHPLPGHGAAQVKFSPTSWSWPFWRWWKASAKMRSDKRPEQTPNPGWD